MTEIEYVAALAHVLNEHAGIDWDRALELAPLMLDDLAEENYHLVTPVPLDELALDGGNEVAHGVRQDDESPAEVHWVLFTPKHHLASIASQSGVLVVARPTKPTREGEPDAGTG